MRATLRRAKAPSSIAPDLYASSGRPPATKMRLRRNAWPDRRVCGVREKKKNLQRQLTIGKSDDPMEQEAERIADQLSASPAHSIAGGAPVHIQRFTETREAEQAPQSVDQVLAAPGQPLEPALRRDMEERFGHDFSSVRVHSNAAAEQSARDVNAEAYTIGSDIVFGAGRYAAATHEGRRLIAHELTHVVQQGGAAALGSVNADRAGISHLHPVPSVVQRQPAPAAPTNDAPKADAPAAPSGAAAKAAVPAAASAQQLPTCQGHCGGTVEA